MAAAFCDEALSTATALIHHTKNENNPNRVENPMTRGDSSVAIGEEMEDVATARYLAPVSCRNCAPRLLGVSQVALGAQSVVVAAAKVHLSPNRSGSIVPTLTQDHALRGQGLGQYAATSKNPSSQGR